MLIDFGFDLAGRRDARLRRGFVLGSLAALAEAVPYIELYRVMTRLLAGNLSVALAIEAGLVLTLAGLGLILLRARANLCNYTATYALSAEMRLNLADHLSHLPAGFFAHHRRAELAELLTGRLDLYQDVLTQVWGNAVVNIALPVILAVLLLLIDPLPAMALLLFTALAFIAVPWSLRLLARGAQRLTRHRDRMVNAVLEQIEGQAELRQYAGGAARIAATDDITRAYEKAQMDCELKPAPALLTFGLALNLGLSLVALAGVWRFTRGDIDAAALLCFLVLALRYVKAIADLGINMAEIRFARETLASIRRIFAEPVLSEPVHPVSPGATAEIRFDNVGFTYPGRDTPALSCISGTVPAGALVALVGDSGSGKSTLAGMLVRFRDPDEGVIRIGGVDLRDLALADLHRMIAFTPQETALLPGTIADNIRFGCADAPDDAVHAAAAAAQADRFIRALPQGYDTPLDPDPGLSGGERQRIALARAILKDAPVVVLDEATASIDLAHEAEIQQALGHLAVGRTVIMIAHRLWTVRDADEIWVMRDGRIVQRGRHDDLMAQEEGLYRALWLAQQPADREQVSG